MKSLKIIVITSKNYDNKNIFDNIKNIILYFYFFRIMVNILFNLFSKNVYSITYDIYSEIINLIIINFCSIKSLTIFFIYFYIGFQLTKLCGFFLDIAKIKGGLFSESLLFDLEFLGFSF